MNYPKIINPDNNQASLVILDNHILDLSLENNLPSLFNKKSHQRLIKPLAYRKINTGIPRHFTPAAQEWFNSIYAYNKNYIKSLPSADKRLRGLLNTYSNSYINPKVVLSKAKPTHQKKAKPTNPGPKIRFKRKRRPTIKVRPLKIRRVSTRRVFVGKGELKHTAKKALLTFYQYSTEGMVLSYNYNALVQGLIHPWNKLKETITWKTKPKKKITTYNRIFSLKEFLVLRNHDYWQLQLLTSLVTKQNEILIDANTYYEGINSSVERDVLNSDESEDKFKFIPTISVVGYPDNCVYSDYMEKNYEKWLYLYHYLLKADVYKYTYLHMLKLMSLVYDMYKKNISINLVNLKKMHLNSDIFAQAVALKLRNRNNKLYPVLKSAVRQVIVEPISRIYQKVIKSVRDIVGYFPNKVKNDDTITMLKVASKSSITDLLYDNIAQPAGSIFDKGLAVFLCVTKSLMHQIIRGVTVEAKGRLTRQATASRSVFKTRIMGGLKNIRSSFRGWSATMLRGIYNNNVQYSIISSNNSNGAYGVKTWVGNK